MGICFTQATIKSAPDRQNLIMRSNISRVMKLTSNLYLDIHDDYSFIRVLGHGQYGAVREAHKNVSNQIVGKTYAIKSISKNKMNVIMMRRELEIMSLLDHPNIIRLYETYEDEQYVHIVMEYCEGGDVAERIINDGKFSEGEAAKIMEKLLGAVNYLHMHQVSHRDLKAENFLYEKIEQGSEIKIADFGMSAKFGNNQRMQSLAGTPYYLAPEVLQGSYTKSCDIWSLGVFLYFILSGSHPFRGICIDEVFEKVTIGAVKFEGGEWGKISSQAVDLIKHMLTSDPKKRITIKKALTHPWFTAHKNEKPEPVPFSIFNSLKCYKAESKLWQEALKIMVRALSSQQISQMKKWFVTIDTNNSGSISASELERAMKLSGYQIAQEEISAIIRNNAYLGEGKINYTDFLIATLDRKKLLDEEVLWQAFKYFDVDNDGVISFFDLKAAFLKAGTDFTDNEIDTSLSNMQLEEFENADFEKFKEILNSKHQESEDLKGGDSPINRIVRKLTFDFKKIH